jgi:ABC-type nitrate/sulfonate/bicarbonate transport system substrate-binding protein
MRRRSRRLLAALILAGALPPCGAAAGEPVRIRVGWVVATTQITPVLLEKKDLLQHYGKSYIFEPVHFEGSTPQIPALAARDLEIAALAYSSFALTIQNAKLDIKLIADMFQDGVPGYFSTNFMVRADSPIRTAADLRGKTVATNAIGGAVDVAARAMLRRHGLEDKRDLTIVEARFPAMEAMLREGRVDAAGFVQPFYSEAMSRGGLRTLFTQRDAVGISDMIFWAARTEFLAQHRAAVVDFLEDTIRSLRWHMDPKNRDEAIGVVARLIKKRPEDLRPWMLTGQDVYRDPNAMPNVDALQRNVDLLRELGFIKDPLDVRRHADLSLIEAARARLR